MKVFKFTHNPQVKAGCCNWKTSTTYWMAESREDAEREIAAHTAEEQEDHGNCPVCFAELLADGDYEVVDIGGGQ